MGPPEKGTRILMMSTLTVKVGGELNTGALDPARRPIITNGYIIRRVSALPKPDTFIGHN